MNKTQTQTLLATLSLLCAWLFSAGCGSLDKTGVYQGDRAAYHAELAITTSYDMIRTYVTWEYQNRAALKHLPQIRASADQMRRDAPGWFRSAHALHDAYKVEPSEANKTALQNILALLRAALTEAANWMTTGAALPPPI